MEHGYVSQQAQHLTPVHHRDVTITANDGVPLAATVFARDHVPLLSPITIIAGATGVPRSFYGRFAGFLAEHGRVAVTFDYRGIGGSLKGHVKNSTARFRDWGIIDGPSVLTWVAATYPGHPIHWVGQSYGGFATGLAYNNHLITRQFSMSAMSADYRFVTNKFETLRIGALLFGIGPVIARTFGYVPGWMNGGADLPKGVLLEWAQWCRTRGFLFGLDDLPERKYFAQMHAPMCFAYMDDDAWLSRAGVEHLARQYSHAASHAILELKHQNSGAATVGHIGFFRSQFRPTLWPSALAWLDGKDDDPTFHANLYSIHAQHP
jgi:predicted alpha/beta hydrolase